MSEEQLKAFLEKAKADTNLQQQLKAAEDSDAVASIAKEAGFMISADDFKNLQSEISEEELEAVAGGHGWTGWEQWKGPTKTGVVETGHCAGICE